MLVEVIFRTDVRRLAISGEPSFDGLVALMRERFHRPESAFRLTYKDPEGDTCAITSDDELIEALRLSSECGTHLRLHAVELLTDGSTPRANSEDDLVSFSTDDSFEDLVPPAPAPEVVSPAAHDEIEAARPDHELATPDAPEQNDIRPALLDEAHVIAHANRMLAHSSNIIDTGSLVYCEGAAGWVEYTVPALETAHSHMLLVLRYATADPRPLRVCIDGELQGSAAELSTGGWDADDSQWHATLPIRLDWSQPHVIRLETDGFFPHLVGYGLVPCDTATPEKHRAHLSKLLDATLSANDADLEKALFLVSALKEMLFGRAKGLRALQLETIEALAATLTAARHQTVAAVSAGERLAREPPLEAIETSVVTDVEITSRTDADAVHRGITCDGCGRNPIEGIRYKCMNCADFDLCDTCERAGVHDHHVFLKLKQPLQVVHQASWTTDQGQTIGTNIDSPTAGLAAPGVPALPSAPASLSASFVKDVTIEDETVLAPGTRFTKVWRIRNSGKTAWPKDTELHAVKGEMMACEADQSIRVRPLLPGEDADIAVELTAPTQPGEYCMYWRLASVSLAAESAHHFWVMVRVAEPEADGNAEAMNKPDRCDLHHADTLKQLSAMGFHDVDMNLKALELTEGRVDATVELLLAQM
jgi:hypothetical protein